ncbi:MAG: peptidylprolyl isomerase [Ruminococcus sp.]|nr:peptidylprolyl isomerase [Ruminococcus sp.]
MKKIIAAAIPMLFILAGCGKTLNVTEGIPQNATAANSAISDTTDETSSQLTSTADGGEIVITLHPDYAPITCENFEKLVGEGFYDGLTFHRVVEGFMAQGGDPEGTGMGGSEETIKGEFSSNGVENELSHTRGVVSMARSMDPDSASSQFFICYDDSCTFLDGNYAAFGEVTEGMEVVDDFLKVPRQLGSDNEISSPEKPIVMNKVEMIEDDSEGNPRVKITMNDFLGE